ncbi:Transposase (plasmid) [Mycetohabitans rhizoxinica HKI 454]|uniref:Transposase n=2 Tax=Mycetohabitans rhizoxinica TaxID=412963 RepID=E5ATT6_MYCRK|nr:IS3 family transposase [Mycetohabitans sp. B2]MCG1048636.1 IS3 family transposase [Mycetohabitans sp. B6]CBW76510.1 Transposase [Mycetohabitans rhizoxinica HKI 454]
MCSDRSGTTGGQNIDAASKSALLLRVRSRRGNCLDNAAIESFSDTLKSAFYYLNALRDVQELQTGIDSYIRHYNYDRIKVPLRGLSPLEYRPRFAKA